MEKIFIAELIFLISLIGTVGFIYSFLFITLSNDFKLSNKFLRKLTIIFQIMCFGGWILLYFYMKENNIEMLPLNF